MQINRGLVFWGVALITAGAVALAIQSDAIDGDSARRLWRYWPVVLIVIGLAVIAARTPLAMVGTLAAGLVVGGLAGTLVSGWPDGLSLGCGGETPESVSADGGFESRGEVTLDLNCGDLAVSTDDGAAWSVAARYADVEPEISSDAGSLHVRSRGGGFPGFDDSRQAWDVILPTDVELDLSVDANAASSALDLGGANLTSFQIDANAGEVTIRLPSAAVEDLSVDANAGSISIETDGSTTLAGSVEMNAGSLELCVPDSVVVAITIEDDNVTFSHNLGESGLTREGDTWRSGSGTAAVTLDVDGNAASFSLNPEGGCS